MEPLVDDLRDKNMQDQIIDKYNTSSALAERTPLDDHPALVEAGLNEKKSRFPQAMKEAMESLARSKNNSWTRTGVEL
jgi:hypothetical protein